MADDFSCSNGFEDLEVELVRVSHERPFEMFWDWYKETWLDLHGVPYDPNDATHVKACRDVVERKALPTPMEVLSFEVRITGLSRVALAQITRGRIGHCYNVQSQMPQHLRHGATIPKNIYEHPLFGPRARQLQQLASSLYDDMYADGVPPQDCRYMTLHGQQTSMMWSVNFGALVGWYSMRCENGLTDELNTVGRKLRKLLVDRFIRKGPAFMYDEPGTWVELERGSGWRHLIDKLDCMGAAQGKCLNGDRVFGNTGRFPSAGQWVPSSTNDETPADFAFDRSAFYLELLEMPPELLFRGECEMVSDWRDVGYDGRLRKLGDR